MYQYDLLIIGGGPAGYVAAIRAAQLGLKTAVCEKSAMGGTCLNVGCIPTKALYQSAGLARAIAGADRFGIRAAEPTVDFSKVMEHKDSVVAQLVGGVAHLMKKNKVVVIPEQVAFVDPHTLEDGDGKRYTAGFILIATGSVNHMPPIAGIQGRNVIDSTGALALKELPRSIAVIGGGVIGVELGSIFSSLGAEVSILEMMPQLIRGADKDFAQLLKAQLERQNIRCALTAAVKSIEDGKNGNKTIAFELDGALQRVEAEYALVATGRAPNTQALHLERAGVQQKERGWIETDSRMRTNVEHIYAAGDVAGNSSLAHAAYEEGIVAIENIVGGSSRTMQYHAVPKVVFASSEIAWVGMTEEEAKAAGYTPLTGMFSLAGNGKALAEGAPDGFVKVVSETEYHRILGIHIAGASASELIATGASLLALESGLEDVEATIYPHPSVSEAIREACLVALGRPVHS